MTVSFQIPDEVWMEIVQASCEVEEKKSYGEYLDLKEPFQLWQIRQQERQHSVYALSQTSKYFCNLLACKLFSHPAIAYEGDDRIDRHSLLIQLKQMLERPIVRENIHSLTLDFRDLGDYSLCFAYDLKRKWEKDLEYSDYARNIIPTLRDFIKVEDELAQKLRGLSLVSFGRTEFHYTLRHRSCLSLFLFLPMGICRNISNGEVFGGRQPKSMKLWDQSKHWNR